MNSKKNKGRDKKKRREEALELAELIYDIFVEEKKKSKIINGQNNVQQITKK